MPRLVLALALACSTLTLPTVADACGNSVTASLYRRIRTAEAALDAGQPDCVREPARCSPDLVPSSDGELAEALARSPDLRGEALAILGRLAEADLMPGPDAWAALARLRGEQGDAAGREVAVLRCRQMAARPARCGAL